MGHELARILDLFYDCANSAIPFECSVVSNLLCRLDGLAGLISGTSTWHFLIKALIPQVRKSRQGYQYLLNICLPIYSQKLGINCRIGL